MKHFKKVIMWIMLLFGVLIVFVHVMSNRFVKETNSSRNVAMNYIVNEIQIAYDMGGRNGTRIIETVYSTNKEDWQKKFGKDNMPERIYYEEISRQRKNVNIQIKAETNQYIWNLYNSDEDIIDGFIVFEYEDDIYPKILLMAESIIVVIALCVLVFGIFIYLKILKPFEEFSTYPERLSKGEITEKLPESQNRYWGKYFWGMNMLNDKLSEDKKKIQKLAVERQTFVSAIAHGIKTPLSNIKLYADAINTGLYQDNRIVNEKDAVIARKIEKNAADIEQLVTEMINVSSSALFEYEPNISAFYLKELEEYILQEYSNKFRVNRIPFTVETSGNPLINSDKSGICRMLCQLLDNAIKYGDGTGITVSMEKQEDGYFLSVKNKGKGLQNNEIPYVFNSFWRGSNAENTEGSGIGLYEARRIAKCLGGDIYIKNGNNEVEVIIVLLSV